VEEKNISLDSLLEEINITLDQSKIDTDSIIVVPQPQLNSDDVTMIKRLRANNKKVHIHDFENRKYVEMRGGEFDLALMIIDKFAIPIIVSLTTMWIGKRLQAWKDEKKEVAPDSLVDPPDFKMEFYIKNNERYVKIEGDAETALNELKKLQDDD